MRLVVLERDGWRCQHCGRAGRLEVDHVTPLDEGGDPWELTNLQALCKPCHVVKTRAERGESPLPEVEAWRALLERMAD